MIRKNGVISLFDVIEFEAAYMEKSIRPGTKNSLFFDHRNPEIIKWMATRKLEI